MVAKKTTRKSKTTSRSSTSSKASTSKRAVRASAAPKLPNWQWIAMGLMGVLFLLTALLQLISFNDFKDSLSAAGLAGPTAWAVAIILAEIWASAGFLKLPLSVAFRMVSYGLAVLVASFWFVYNLQLISSGIGEQLNDSGFFGGFLTQGPGWWTAVEVSLVLFLVIYMVEVLRGNQPVSKR